MTNVFPSNIGHHSNSLAKECKFYPSGKWDHNIIEFWKSMEAHEVSFCAQENFSCKWESVTLRVSEFYSQVSPLPPVMCIFLIF